jgi:hypothetical protein
MEVAKFLAIWAAVGPLVGVVVGGLLTAWWQRRQWILDNKALEYRQALDALNTYRFRFLNYYAGHAGGIVARDARAVAEEGMALGQAQVQLDNVLADRIFTLQAVAKSGVREDLARFYQAQISASPPTITDSTMAFADMHLKLLETAVADLRLKRVSRN